MGVLVAFFVKILIFLVDFEGFGQGFGRVFSMFFRIFIEHCDLVKNSVFPPENL